MGDSRRAGCGGGIGLGSVCAAVISWALNHSLPWAILHFILGWIYVLWAIFMRTNEIIPALRRMFGA